MDKSKMTHTDWEKQLKGALLLIREEPVEVIFSGGVSKTISVIPWSMFVLAMDKLLADARKEVIKRIEAMPDKDVRPQITVWLESKEYCLGYNKALSNVLATLREEEKHG